MNDFFSILAARVRAVEPALQPNLTSPHHPARGVPDIASLNPVEMVTGPAALRPAPRSSNADPHTSDQPASAGSGGLGERRESPQPQPGVVASAGQSVLSAPAPAPWLDLQPPTAVLPDERSGSTPASGLPSPRAASSGELAAAPTLGAPPSMAMPPGRSDPEAASPTRVESLAVESRPPSAGPGTAPNVVPENIGYYRIYRARPPRDRFARAGFLPLPAKQRPRTAPERPTLRPLLSPLPRRRPRRFT